MNILVVEDEPVSRKLVCIVLEAEGHTLMQVETAETALQLIKRSRPDLIIVDLKLPGMDGLSLTRQLKQDAEVCHITVIAMTAYPEDWGRQQALEAGCDLYIVKPIDIKALRKQVADGESGLN